MASIHGQSQDEDETSRLSSINTEPTNIISPAVPSTTIEDSNFIQNQTSLQRLPSSSNSHKSSLSRQLSTNSSSSFDDCLTQSGIINVLAFGESKSERARVNSTGSAGSAGSVTDGVNACTLSKSLSTSARSTHSVRSVAAVGTYPFGTLGVHSGERRQGGPSPGCLLSGDVVIMTGMPSGSIFGFDTVSFTLGNDSHHAERVHGIRDIPSGPHFIYGGSSSELSTRNGYWIMSQRKASTEHGEVFVKRWDSYSETLEDEINTAEVRIQTENVPKVFNFLLPYGPSQGQHSSNKSLGVKDPGIWNCLTFAIKGAMLTRITGQPWNKWHISSQHEARNMEVKPTNAKMNTILDLASERAEQKVGKDRILAFAFPRTGVTFSSEVIGRARTEQAMDTSVHIVSIVRDRCTFEDFDEVIGELQFCYLTGVLLGNVECQEQWAHLVKVVFKAFRLAMDMPTFFRKLIETIHAQLIFDEEGIEGSIFDHNPSLISDLKFILTVFKSRLNEQLLEENADLTEDQNEVGKAFEALESWLWKWGWDLRGNYVRSGKIQLEDGEFVDAELEEFEAEDERGEYAPVVVDLEEDGREKGLIRW